MDGSCPLFGGEKKSFCSYCTVEGGKDIQSMSDRCVNALSKIRRCRREELRTLLERIIAMGKTGRLPEESKKNLVVLLNSCVDLSEHSNDIARLTGNAYAFLGFNSRAMESYEMAISRDQNDTTALNNEGVLLARTGNTKDAIKRYERVTELDPENENAWFNMGKAYSRMKKSSKAANCFRKVLEINPENVSAWNNLGVSLRLIGKIGEAIECYNSALKIRRDYKWAWNNLGIAYMIKGKYEKAEESFLKALEIDPDFKEAREGLEACAAK